MAWKQKLAPNLDDNPNNPLYVWQGGQILTDWYGWCLAVVAASYGAKGSSYSAKTAWQSCQNKHADYDIPQKVYVPLWYGGGDYGHVVIGYRDGNNLTVWSSPYTHIATFQKFTGEINWLLNYIGQVYGVGNFSGWSPTVLDSWVLEWVDVPKPSQPEPTPEPEPDPEPEPEPEPTPEPEPEPGPGDDGDGKEDDMPTPVPNANTDQQIARGVLDEVISNSPFEPSDKAKAFAYILGDSLIILALLVPDIINAIQAPTLPILGEYVAKVLIEAGTCILMVFKLIKKKS